MCKHEKELHALKHRLAKLEGHAKDLDTRMAKNNLVARVEALEAKKSS